MSFLWSSKSKSKQSLIATTDSLPLYETVATTPMGMVESKPTVDEKITMDSLAFLDLKQKKNLIKKCCATGTVDDIKKIIDGVPEKIEGLRRKIIPKDYEEYLQIAINNERSDICIRMLTYNFYPIEFKFMRHLIMFACKTGNCELFDLSISQVSFVHYNHVFYLSIKYNHINLVNHIISTYRNKLDIKSLILRINEQKYCIYDAFHPKSEDKIWNGFFTLFTDNIYTTPDIHNITHTWSTTDPFVFKMEDILLTTSQNNFEMFQIIAPLFMTEYTAEKKDKFIGELLRTSSKEILVEMKKYGFFSVYNKEYFEWAETNPHADEVMDFLVECFQK